MQRQPYPAPQTRTLIAFGQLRDVGSPIPRARRLEQPDFANLAIEALAGDQASTADHNVCSEVEDSDFLS
jgi:hypothetical protein